MMKIDTLILGDGGEADGGKLDDPRPFHATRRNSQASGCFHDGGELQLNAGEREPEHSVARAMVIAIGITSIICLCITLKRRDEDCTGKIGTENREEEEFALRIHVGRRFGKRRRG
jgi:hypothetical protein